MRTLITILTTLALAVQLHGKPLKVFLLAGQSNMQGHAKVSTFEHFGMDPATKPMLAEMPGADGKPKVCERVWIPGHGHHWLANAESYFLIGEAAGEGIKSLLK